MEQSQKRAYSPTGKYGEKEGSEELYYDVKEFMEHYYPEIAMGLEVTWKPSPFMVRSFRRTLP